MSRRPNEPEKGPKFETDPRFPSGEWTGFFLQPALPGRHWMELHLTFQNGVIQGEGRDFVGKFVFKGKYDLENGQCHWTKTYIGKHSIFYQGYNEGKGIWGVWEWGTEWRGGFHIWPVAMGDPSQGKLRAAAEIPHPAEPQRVRKRKKATVGA